MRKSIAAGIKQIFLLLAWQENNPQIPLKIMISFDHKTCVAKKQLFLLNIRDIKCIGLLDTSTLLQKNGVIGENIEI